jgi:ABC-type phosphate transport system permease subunit
MVTNLTALQKQEIRDKIERLKHLKEPYIKAMEIALPIFFAILISILSIVSSDTNNMNIVKGYNVTFFINNTGNLSQLENALISPLNAPDFQKIKNTLYYLFLIPIVLYLFFILATIFLTKYDQYDKAIKDMYNQLLGIVQEPKQSFFSKIRERYTLKNEILKEELEIKRLEKQRAIKEINKKS